MGRFQDDTILRMMDPWDIQYYCLLGEDSPVYEFIESLSEKAQAKVFRTIDLLAEYGLQLREPHVKKLTGTSLWELRILGEDSIRVFYIAVENSQFLMLHGFKKKSQKAPKNEIKIALHRLEEYKSRSK
jgi:phage-related protein